MPFTPEQEEDLLAPGRAATREYIRKALEPHTPDPVTYNCTSCGASYEAILDGLAKDCVRDGKPHLRKPTIFD